MNRTHLGTWLQVSSNVLFNAKVLQGPKQDLKGLLVHAKSLARSDAMRILFQVGAICANP